MSRVPLLPLEDLIVEVIDRRGVTPRKLGSEFTSEGYRVISARSIRNRTVDLTADDERYVSEEVYRRWMKTPLCKGDVLLTSEAPLGEPAYVKETHPWVVGQRLFAIRTDPRKLIGRYLFYAVQSDVVREDLLSRATGTTVLGIRQSELRQVRIPVPSLAVQEAIVEILGAIDDKIELNRRMSETLEEIARTLFDHWLLDTSTANTIASEEHQAGTTFADVVHEHKEKWLPVKDEVVDHHSLPAFDSGAQAVREHSSSIKSTKTLVPRGAILVSRLNPRIPRVWLTDVSDVVPAVASTEFLVTTAKEPFGRSYLYLLASSRAFQQSLASMATGTSGSHQRVRPASVMGLHVPTAPAPELARLEATLGPLLDRIAVARRESKTLADLLDALLPQLISGELRVPEAEQLVSEVA